MIWIHFILFHTYNVGEGRCRNGHHSATFVIWFAWRHHISMYVNFYNCSPYNFQIKRCTGGLCMLSYLFCRSSIIQLCYLYLFTYNVGQHDFNITCCSCRLPQYHMLLLSFTITWQVPLVKKKRGPFMRTRVQPRSICDFVLLNRYFF